MLVGVWKVCLFTFGLVFVVVRYILSCLCAVWFETRARLIVPSVRRARAEMSAVHGVEDALNKFENVDFRILIGVL